MGITRILGYRNRMPDGEGTRECQSEKNVYKIKLKAVRVVVHVRSRLLARATLRDDVTHAFGTNFIYVEPYRVSL